MQSDNLSELVKRGSDTAKAGFRNEEDVISKFNHWKTDADAQRWLDLMGYAFNNIERVEAVKVTGSYKTDVQVKIKIYLKEAIAAENISIKLVSNPQGFNQIDKRRIDKYVELWAIPENIAVALQYFTGEILPNIDNARDRRRVYLNEMSAEIQNKVIRFFESNKIMILNDIFKGRDKLAAGWMLIYLKDSNQWSLLPMSVVMNYYGDGPVVITGKGNLRIGKVGMQRKGGDGGRSTSQMLQFKINPAAIVAQNT